MKKENMGKVILRPSFDEYLDAYKATGNGTHFFRAWVEARASGYGVTEEMLERMDWFAERLSKANGQREIAEAVEMTRRAGHGKAAKQADHDVVRLRLMRDVWNAACRDTGQAPMLNVQPVLRGPVAEAVAKKHGKTKAALQVQWGRFWKAKRMNRTPQGAKEVRDVFDMLVAVLRHKS